MNFSRNLIVFAMFSASVMACKSSSHSQAKSANDDLSSPDRVTLDGALGQYQGSHGDCSVIVKGTSGSDGELIGLPITITSQSGVETAVLPASQISAGQSSAISSGALTADYDGSSFRRVEINGLACADLAKSSDKADVTPAKATSNRSGRR